MPIAKSAHIHASAIVDSQADIGENVQIGPFVVIEGPVRIGPNCIIRSHAFLQGPMTIGCGNDIGVSVILGERPQHLGYKGEETRTEIGDRNIIREHTTVHRGTTASGTTIIGNDNFLMVHCHVGHDARVGNNTTLVNGTLLGGHSVVEDRALLSGNAAVHQFTRMGRLSLLTGLSSITKDLPPFMVGYMRNTVIGINRVGMRRAGMSRDDINAAQHACRILYHGGLIQKLAVQKLEQELGDQPVGAEILAFIRSSKRGIIGPDLSGSDHSSAEAA